MIRDTPVTPVDPSPGSAVGERSGTSVPAVALEHVSFAFDDHVVLRDVSFTVPKGSMTILLGASGAGKSIVLKLILGLIRPDSGAISVNGHRIDQMAEVDLLQLRSDVGISFQENALFDSLTVAQNVGFRLNDAAHLSDSEVDARVAEVLEFVGLAEYGERMPSALSGGQRRRVGIARAMASKPSLLLFDDPTTGLDPVIASNVDDEIVKLRDLEHVTSILVTHQIRDAFYIATHEAVRQGGQLEIRDAAAERARFLVLHDGRIYAEGTGAELLASKDPYLHEFLFMTLPPW
jgi:phospholipid/cholesterol/gamma-HCH transport system ATP-binding protein